jgi:hypothetical protein
VAHTQEKTYRDNGKETTHSLLLAFLIKPVLPCAEKQEFQFT